MNQFVEIDTATATALEEAEAAKLLALKRAKKKAMYKRAMAMREVLVERFPDIFCGFRLPKEAAQAQNPSRSPASVPGGAAQGRQRGPAQLHARPDLSVGACSGRAAKFDLEGNVASYVTIQEAEFARKDLHAGSHPPCSILPPLPGAVAAMTDVLILQLLALFVGSFAFLFIILISLHII